ncbi:tRNA pseudouridine synthase A, mitochondrial [Orchesella cincta]|uniref:Pseudouridylate synthase 1 homolog n=1 Tax=Orchesella cincta TaxID=48709 RepID=A0A1D2N8H9_ORCCI|nr:tRNA pseudouridine synthase A, mitochondrial [Orchesella cincta]
MAAKISNLLMTCSSIAVSRAILTSVVPAKFPNSSVFCFLWSNPLSGAIGNLRFQQSHRMASTATESVVPVVKEEPTGNSISEPLELESSVTTSQAPAVVLEETSSKSVAVENTPSNVTSQSDTNTERPNRLKLIKAAILLSYNGQGYFGMQMQNNGTKTIENDLMKAFLDAEFVSEEGFQKPKSIKFQRAARTDKNVSAARQIISVKVPKLFDPDAVNKHLPDQIRVMDFRRVTHGFDAKIACSARTYLYMIPTFAFVPLEQEVTESYRITPEVLATVREKLSQYEGTKNFHNFTSRRKPTDPSSKRFIMSFTASDPFVKDGLEYVVLKVKGQSFMLHQIRKMIGLVVAMLRGFASEETMKSAFTLDKVDIPMAPGLGLMLGEVHYDQYNRKFGNDGIHEPLIWDNVADKIEQFCQDKIYPEVTRTENEDKSMMQWLSTVPFHTFESRDVDIDGKGYGPIGKAHMLVKRERGEDVDEEFEDDEEEDDDDDVPKKKQKRN